MIYVYSQDLSFCEFEGKLESPALSIYSIKDNILLGCQNNTIAYLQPSKKKIKYFIRGNQEIIKGADIC